MARTHPQHLAGFSYLGEYRFSLRFCTHARSRLFVQAPIVTLVLSQFLRAALETQFSVLAYCFMPDHVHLLVQGDTPASDCLRFIALAKQYSGFYYRRAYGEPLWQRYGFERVLRESEPTLSVARYIVGNPVRAGLVRRVEEYPYVGSAVYTLRELLDSVTRESG